MNPRAEALAPDDDAARFYRRVLGLLNESGPPYLVGGAYALAHFAGIARNTKDLDVHVRPEDCDRLLEVLAWDGFQTEHTFPHWLAKAYHGEYFIDVIFNGGNGIMSVDDGWFDHAVKAEILGVPVLLCPPEEMLWSKSFVMERERYDGADVAHLLRACGKSLDWGRLLWRFGPHWPVLLSHLLLFRHIYPAEREAVPGEVLSTLLDWAREQRPDEQRPLCRGTLLSREQYLTAVKEWGYRDARLLPFGNLTEEELAPWQAAIGEEGEGTGEDRQGNEDQPEEPRTQ